MDPVSFLANAGADGADLPATPPGVALTTFANGLSVIVQEDHSAPVVAVQAWCKAGSVHEGKWLGAGLSHVLEHMLFKGTTTRGPGRIDREVQEAGGYLNAFTSFDRTVYWINVPNTGARVAIDILCDIMQHATLPAEELAKEMDVIRREMDMNQDDPGRRAGRRLFETAYTRSPYRFTIIGYPDIFNQLQREDIVAYYQQQYVPNNVFLTVVGDIRREEVLAQVGETFAGAKTRPLPPTVLPEEPRQVAPRELLEEAPIELGHLHYSWHIPDLRDPDVPVLDVLAVLLGGGRSSRLFQQVRERQGLVSSVEAWTYSPGAPGLFGVSATVEVERCEPARAALLTEVARLKQEPVGAAELAKAVKQFQAGFLATRKTMQGQAQDLGGNWLAAGDLNFSARYLAAVRQVTPAHLQRVAQRYLTPDNRTLYALLPVGGAARPNITTELRTEQPTTMFETAHGLRVLLKEDHRLPFVELRLVLGGGVLVEDPACSGVSRSLARTLLQGTTRRSGEQIVTEIESVGGQLDTFSGNHSIGINVEVLSSDFALGVELLADVLLHPTFPAAGLEREREVQLAAIKAQRDQILQVGERALRRTLFGPRGYGLDPLGTEQSVRALRQEDLQKLHRRVVAPRNAVLAVYGDVRPAEAQAAVERVFGAWAADGALVPQATADAGPFEPQARRVVEEVDKTQAVVLVGFPGLTMHHPDRFALELLQEACSDLGSRLFLRIREKLGLAYYVGAVNFLGIRPGYFGFYAGTEPAKARLVEAELLAEARLLCRDGLDAAELQRAKAKLIGQKKIARQDLGHVAQVNALDELYGLGYQNSDAEDAHYAAVTVDEIKVLAARLLQPEAAVVAIAAPPAPCPGEPPSE